MPAGASEAAPRYCFHIERVAADGHDSQHCHARRRQCHVATEYHERARSRRRIASPVPAT